MSSVNSIGAVSGAQSATSANKRAASDVSFGLTLQGLTDKANAEAQAAASSSSSKSSVHDAPKADDSAKSDDAKDTKAAASSDKSDKADASKDTSKTDDANASKPAASADAKPAQAQRGAVAQAKPRADAATASTTADDATLEQLADAAGTVTDTTAATDTGKPSASATHKSGDANSAQDALQSALAAMNAAPVDNSAAAAAAAAAARTQTGTPVTAQNGANGDGQTGVLFNREGKGGLVGYLTPGAGTDDKSATASVSTPVQTDASVLASAQAALTPSADDATAAYKQAADAAAHAVAAQAASASSSVSGTQGSMQAATSAAIAPHVGSSGWDDAFSQKVVFLSNSRQTSAELTLNPKDLGPLQVTLQVTGDHAHALFVAQHVQTREAIEAAMPKLREAMEANGISLGSASVSDGFARQSSGSPSQQQAQSGGGSGRGSSSASAVGGVEASSAASVAVRRQVGLVDTFA